MPLKKNIILSVITLLTAFFSFTQTEAEVKVKADALFKNKEYVEATPLYLRLLSLQPRDYDYSYKYGTCLLFNSNSKQDAIRYLKYAVKSPTPISEAYFFLGKAYHLNYQFNDAIREYKNYLSKAGTKGEYTAESNRNIAMCENGKNLLTTLTDVIVRKKTEIKQEDFFRLYDLTDIGGSIIVAIDFQTKNDKKYNHKPVVHISPKMENVYFSSYGDGDNLDIYVARRLPNGKFGAPQKIMGGVNTPFDEDFPYMHPNGRELFFSSKGHNSMGGYDIFRARFDEENNTFGDVTNVDFSISSPDDDLLYIVDKENKNAYFSSKRQSQDGKVVVYQVGVERIPIQLAIVKGSFQSSVLSNNPKMTVEVIDKTNGRKIGVFNTLKENSYLITFPKGGKYEYKITIDGSTETFHADVDIPYLKELRPLKQKIDHELVESKERIRITNLFDEQFEDAQSIVAQVLKERANLNVNEDQFDTKEIEEQAKTRAILADLRLENRSLSEIGQFLESKTTELKELSKTGTQIETSVNGINIGLYNEIAAIDNEVKSLVKEADLTESNRRKETVLNNAKELYVLRDEKLQKIQQMQKESTELSSNSSGNTPQDTKKLEQISKEYNQLISEGKISEINNLLNTNKDYLKTVLNANSSVSEALLKKQNDSDKEITRLQTIEQGNSEEVNRLQGEIQTLNNQKDNAKEKDKQYFQDKIDEKTYQLEDAKSALSKVKSLISEEIAKRNEINQKLNVVHEIESYKGKQASKEDVAKAKAEISEEKSRTLKSYIETSLAELAARDLDGDKGVVALKTIEQYNSASEGIYSNSEWSDYEKQRKLLALNTEKTQELITLIQTIDSDNSLSGEEKTQQKTTTQKLIQKLNDDQTSLKKNLEISSRKEIDNLRTEEIISKINPDYQEKIKQVQQNKNASESEKSEQLNRVDSELITSISVEISRLKNDQKANEDNALTNAKIELLEKHRTYLQQAINERKKLEEDRRKNEELADNKGIVNNQTGGGIVKTNEQISAEIQSGYKGNLQSDLSQSHTSVASIQQNIQRLEVYSNQLKQLLNETNTVANQQERENRETAIRQEISRVNDRVGQLKTELERQKTSNELAGSTNNHPGGVLKTSTEIAKEIQSGYKGNLQSDLTQSHTSVALIQQNIQRLEGYNNQLKQLLKETNIIENEQERENRQSVIFEEISHVNDRVEQLTTELESRKSSDDEPQELAGTTDNKGTETNHTASIVKTSEQISVEVQFSYNGNLQSDLSQSHTSVASIQQNIQRLEVYSNQLKQSLKETNTVANQQERENHQAVIFEELSRVNDRVEQLKTELESRKFSDELAGTTDNKGTENNQTAGSVKTSADIATEIQSGYKGNLQSDLNQSHTSVASIQQNIQRLEVYNNQLNQLLNETNTVANQQERENHQAVIFEELSRVNDRVEQLKTELESRKFSDELAGTTDNKGTENNQTAGSVKTSADIATEIQSGYKGNLQSDLNQSHTSVASIQQNIQRLEVYNNQLNQLLNETNTVANQQERENRETAIKKEISRIDNRIEQLTTVLESQKSLDELKVKGVEDISQNQTGNNTTEESREQEITSLLTNTEMSKLERKQLTKELSDLKREQAVEAVIEKKNEHIQLSDEIKRTQENNGLAAKTISNTTNSYNQESTRLSKELALEKEPLKQEVLLNQLIAKDEQYINDLGRVVRLEENESIIEIDPKTRIYTQEQLQSLRRQGVIEFDEIVLLKMERTKQMATVSKKEQEGIKQEIAVLDERTKSIRKEQDFIEEQLKLYTPLERSLELKDNKIQLTYNEERQLASSENYEKYAEIISKQNQLINKHQQLSKELIESQQQFERLRTSTTAADTEQKQNTIEKIRMISLSLEELESQISNANKEAITYLPQNTDDMMKFQNLVARGVNPIKKSLVATALIPLSASGIEFSPSTPAIPELKTIPVGVTTPKGLVYRVQVGAFARPIPEDHFKEFTPVSGEKIENSTITRYMAGYFNNASTVVEARDKIKQIGYNDAFIVAYCDGKRITFGEARRMEERKECVGIGADELQLEAATNIVKTLGIEDTVKTLKKVPEWSYNQSQGAAKATAIEQFDSELIFFTVQVGVFNRPVEKERLHNLSPLYTLRLDNGQIRYSVGMYGELAKAKLLEREIRQKGIADAFVTAYYQGKRIDIDKARTLLGSGKAKLYSEEQVIIPQETIVKEPVKEVELFSVKTIIKHEPPREEKYLQFVSKQMYDVYPREDLNRFNSKGNFYYDKGEKRIKSSFYSDEELLPRIASFSDQIDTLYFSKSDILKSNDSKITFVLNNQTVPGDLSDWLMKFPYRKIITHSENGLEIHIFDVRLEDAEQMRIMSNILGYPLIETQNLREYDRSDE